MPEAVQGSHCLADLLFAVLCRPPAPSTCLRSQGASPSFETTLPDVPVSDPHRRAPSIDAVRAMRLDDLMRFAGRFFEEEKTDYFIFGAVAMNLWIPPRTTANIDAALCVDKRRARQLVEKLRVNRFNITPTLAGRLLKCRRVTVRAGESDLDLKLAVSDHEREALARSRVFKAEDFKLRIAVPEDLVLFKLQSWRLQDRADIERLWKTRRDLDVPYITSWLDRLEEFTGCPMSARWNEIRGVS